MFQENLRIFLKDFGQKISFTLIDGTVINKDVNGEDLLGILDLTYANAELGYLAVKNSKPRLTCVQEDIAKIIKGTSVETEDCSTYKVLSNDEDGTGFAIIELTNK